MFAFSLVCNLPTKVNPTRQRASSFSQLRPRAVASTITPTAPTANIAAAAATSATTEATTSDTTTRQQQTLPDRPNLTKEQNDLLKAAGLEVKISSLGPHAGYGLFATRFFSGGSDGKYGKRNGEVIVAYGGVESVTRPNSFYILQTSGNKWIDASDPTNGVGRFANSLRPEDMERLGKHSQNATFTAQKNLRARKHIYAGDEIFVAYGSAYHWPSDLEATTTTSSTNSTPAILSTNAATSEEAVASTTSTTASTTETYDDTDDTIPLSLLLHQ